MAESLSGSRWVIQRLCKPYTRNISLSNNFVSMLRLDRYPGITLHNNFVSTKKNATLERSARGRAGTSGISNGEMIRRYPG
jgi:hypothetical protein